jgi:hypothetical protein
MFLCQASELKIKGLLYDYMFTGRRIRVKNFQLNKTHHLH